ncbi:hypothetical protein ACHAXS_012536 [Conticribra weissflogii]
MGNETSNPQENELEDEFAKFDGIETLGYRVLGVQPNSPASAAGLVSFLDFLVGCNGEMLLGSGEGLEEGEEYDDVDFPGVLRDNVGKELELLVHNIKSNSQRLVKITPTADWGGAGLLGVTIRLDNYGGADERLIRVLSVEHNSPAAIAGLVPMSDFLLGTASTSFESDEVLAEVLMMHVDRIVEIYVYSSESDVVRVVTLMPTLSWGGRGLLGAEVGTGYLHRFPKSCRGTDGRSVERKVKMGVRPTEALEGKKLGGVSKASKVDAEDQITRDEDEMVDLTALTDSMSGSMKVMRFEEQMEMEPDPAEEQQQSERPADQTTEQTGEEPAGEPSIESGKVEKLPESHAQHSSEADAVFAGPPPDITSEHISQGAEGLGIDLR